MSTITKTIAVLAACSAVFISGVTSPAPPAPRAEALPRIKVMATGGTIAGAASGPSAIGYTAGEVSAAQLVGAVPGIGKLARISVEQVANIGSQDMNDEVWFKLARRIDDVFANNEADAVVITHGTDTMEETAFFLENVVKSDKPVVVVGSMRPSTAVSADGPANLYEAVKVAGSKEAQGRGALVVMNDTIFETRGLTKTNTSSLQTFQAPNSGPVGHVDAAAVHFIEPVTAYPRPRFKLPAAAPLPRVGIVYAHSNMTADDVNAILATKPQGIVLAGVGDGNASKPALDALHEAAMKGIVVVRSSRVGSGFTFRNVEVNDDQLKFATALDLNPQQARVLLQLSLANEIKTPEGVQKQFEMR